MAITSYAGKAARLQTVISGNTVAHEMEGWELGFEVEKIPIDGFEKSASGYDGNYYRNYTPGLATGDVSFTGVLNSAKLPMTGIKIGVAPTSLFLGLTTAIGFTVTGTFWSVKITQDVYKVARFSATLTVETVSYA